MNWPAMLTNLTVALFLGALSACGRKEEQKPGEPSDPQEEVRYRYREPENEVRLRWAQSSRQRLEEANRPMKLAFLCEDENHKPLADVTLSCTIGTVTVTDEALMTVQTRSESVTSDSAGRVSIAADKAWEIVLQTAWKDGYKSQFRTPDRFRESATQPIVLTFVAPETPPAVVTGTQAGKENSPTPAKASSSPPKPPPAPSTSTALLVEITNETRSVSLHPATVEWAASPWQIFQGGTAVPPDPAARNLVLGPEGAWTAVWKHPAKDDEISITLFAPQPTSETPSKTALLQFPTKLAERIVVEESDHLSAGWISSSLEARFDTCCLWMKRFPKRFYRVTVKH
jgi:hypothetical protein